MSNLNLSINKSGNSTVGNSTVGNSTQPAKSSNKAIYIGVGVIFFIVAGLVIARLFFNWNIITVISNLISTPTPTKLTCPNCSGHGNCDTSTGLCTCTGGYTGTNCDTIPCPNNCSGNYGTCNTSTGICTCTYGFTGTDCASIIKSKCPDNCPYNLCDEITGKCMDKCKTNADCPSKNCVEIDPNSGIGTCTFVYVDPITNVDCKEDKVCGGNYYCNNLGKCSLKLPDGSDCIDSKDDNKCMSTHCNATTRKCEKMPNDSVCVNDTNCISGYCNRGTTANIFLQGKTGTCKDRKKIGDICDTNETDNQCQGQIGCGRMKKGNVLVCCNEIVKDSTDFFKNYCGHVIKSGEPCPIDSVCISNKCINRSGLFKTGWGTCA